MPQKCPYWDIFGLPYCRLHQSQIPNVLPRYEDDTVTLTCEDDGPTTTTTSPGSSTTTSDGTSTTTSDKTSEGTTTKPPPNPGAQERTIIFIEKVKPLMK